MRPVERRRAGNDRPGCVVVENRVLVVIARAAVAIRQDDISAGIDVAAWTDQEDQEVAGPGMREVEPHAQEVNGDVLVNGQGGDGRGQVADIEGSVSGRKDPFLNDPKTARVLILVRL